MSDISLDTVKRVAALSGFGLDDEDLKKFQSQFTEILGYVEKLNDVDVSGLEPTYQVTGLSNVARDDVVIDYKLSREQLLANAPKQRDGSIEVPKVL